MQSLSKLSLVVALAATSCVVEDGSIDDSGPDAGPLADLPPDEDIPFSITDYVGYWRFDESSGTTASDSSGGGNHLTLTNGPVFTTAGRIGGARVFDGANDFAVDTSPTSALRPTTAFAISAWVKLTATDTSGGEVVSMGDNYGLRIAADGNVKSWFWDATTFRLRTTSGINVKDGQWHHLVGQYTGSRVQVYVDGVFRGEVSATGTMRYDQGTSFVIGKHGNGGTSHDFRGTIDEVKVYNHALTAAEIATLAGTTATTAIKVLTWNTGGPLGSTAIDLIAAQNPQVVFLQEVDSPTLVENLRRRLETTQGGTWDSEVRTRGTDTSGSYVAIVSRFTLGSVGYEVIRPPGSYVLSCFSSSAVLWAGRAVVGANITVGGRTVGVVAVRTTSEGERGCAREEENAHIKSWATRFAAPRIYGGDFNMQPSSSEPEYQLMLDSPSPTTDSWRLAVTNGTATAPGGATPSNSTPTRNTRLDYIFFDQGTPNLVVRSSQILDEGSLSDHKMMITTFEVR